MIVSFYILYGRKYRTFLFESVEQANKFMEEENYGVLAETEFGIHLAHMKDKGKQI